MKYLKISNIGLLDIRLVYLMGGTTKSDDKFKIGQFGTGLKYTLAYLLRNHIEFTIFIDGDPLKITTNTEVIRDTPFEIISINGERSSVTTNMGMDWKPWMIIRELWCNALDESQPEFSVVDAITPSEGTTEYYIEMVPDIIDVYNNWNKYFIHDMIPLMETDSFKIYSGGDTLRIYKQGVLISEKKHKSTFSYDVMDADLNELRESKYSVDYHITKCLPHLDKKCAEIFMNNVKDTYEEKMDYTWNLSNIGYGKGWQDAIGNGKYCDYETYTRIADKYPNIEKQAIVQVPKGLFKELVKQFPSISLIRASDKLNEFFETYSDALTDKIKKCRDLLDSVGYFIDPNLSIITGVFGDKQIIAQVSLDDKEIRLSQDLESKSDMELITALIEENEHFKTGMHDESRDFQTHFIELYANLLLKDVKVLL
jgi:hypothetical protein